MSFTLFVILPNKDVCSLRHLASGTPIRAVRKTLELTAGLPAQTYRLTCSEGLVLHEDHVLRMDVNVWDGYVIRAVFLDSWQELYDLIVANDVQHVIKYGAVHMRGDVVWLDAEEKEQARVVMRERGVVALFVASFLGMQDMCRALLSVGVNPNGRTLFGRTPLSAAMVRDHDLVMQLLLSHNASLESRDTDGVTAVDVGRRAAAKQCMRKVRHLYLQSKGESTTTSTTTATEVMRRRVARVVRLPASQAVQKEAPCPGAAAKQALPHDDTPDRSAVLTSGEDIHPGKGSEPREGKSPQAYSHHHLPQKPSRAPAPRPLFRQDRDSQVYTWDSHLSHAAARTPSAAQARLSLASQSEGQIPSRRGSQASRGAGTGWSDNRSVTSSSAATRMLPFRPSVQELSIKGPGSVLTTTTTSSTTPTLSSVTLCSLQPEDRAAAPQRRRPSALLRFLALSPHSHPPTSSSPSSNNHHRSQRPHVPAREPSGRPPTRADSSQMLPESQDQHQGSESAVLGSQEALSVGSAPELTSAAGENARGGGEGGEGNHGDSDDDGGRVLTSRGAGSRFSSRFRTRMLVSRQKQQESWKTMKRRIRLAEEQKRSSALRPQHTSPKPSTDMKESFEHWLERKRREQHSSTDEDTSEDDEDVVYRSSQHSQVLNGWLKDLKQQRSARPHTSSPVSVNRQKSRPQKNGIDGGGGGSGVGAESVTDRQKEGGEGSHPTAYQQWQHRKKRSPTGPQGTLQGMEEAKMQLEEKRKSLLAMALTFQDWTQHAEQRKKLMQAILRADIDKLAAIEQYLSPAQATPRQISFNEWRDKVDKKEAEIRHQRQRMRKEAELRQRNGVVGDEFMRSSPASTQEVWPQQKKETAGKQRNKARRSLDGSDSESVKLSEDEKENAVEEWFKQKRKSEVAQLNEHLRQERRLLLSVRQKKPPTVTQC